MKNKLLILLFLIIGVILITLGFVLHIFPFSKEKVELKDASVTFGEGLKLEVCDDDVNCEVASSIYYYLLEYSGVSKEFSNIIDDINKESRSLYNDAIESKLENKSCASYNNLNYGLFHTNYIVLSSSEEIISIFFNRGMTDLCATTNEVLESKSYIYSVNDEKILSEKEILKYYKIDNDDLELAVNTSILQINYNNNTTYFYEDFFDSDKGFYNYFVDTDGVLKFYWYDKVNKVDVLSVIQK